ncbi:TetR/AcrR family transcriptional regulator [Celeribacter indicus]|uniref:TetR family transcriptional regulator n=1 Tax=Celeribacter indicus TaxID=1208324 RepID=A0A0B5DRC5_9RHOB|nr:TetR/AcrR family transcriptional regulator [Celeribacter indicus]AJE45619.1 TetR family transcriptional regulator [Celeribacter indicus]SDW84435.1 transcriptional regulator, TetR family [Celeribacter indicus]
MSNNTGLCAKPQRRSIGARRNPATEAAILDAAAALVAEKGARGLTMEAVAKRARAGKATLYKWWPNRGALIVAVYERAKGGYVYEEGGSLIDTVAAFYRHLFSLWARPEGGLFALIIAEAQYDADVAEALEGYRLERLAATTAVIERARARGELAPGVDSRRLAETVVAMAWMRLLTRRFDPAEADDLAHAVVGGWIAAPA